MHRADLASSLHGGSSKVDILIATPGRLIDHLQHTRNFSLQHVRFLVIDEADRLLNQSFDGWLSTVQAHIDGRADTFLDLLGGAKRGPTVVVDPLAPARLSQLEARLETELDEPATPSVRHKQRQVTEPN